MLRKNQWPIQYVLLIALTGLGGYLRFRHLAYPSMMADVMEFYKLAKAGVSPWELVRSPTGYGVAGLWAAAHNAVFLLLPLDVTFSNLRIIDVLTGLLTVPAIYLLTRRLGGPWTGLISAAFFALHPIHIQLSRESYPYVAIVFGVTLTLYALLRFQEAATKRYKPGAGSYAAAFIGFALTTMSVAAWPFAGITFGGLFVIIMRSGIKGHIEWKWIIALIGGFLVVSLPILWSGNIQWAIDQLFRVSGDEATSAYWREIFGEKSPGRFVRESLFYIQGYLFGAGPVRSLLNLAVFGLGTHTLLRKIRSHSGAILFFTVFGMVGIAVAISVYRADQILDMRHYAVLFPFMAVWVGLSFRALSLIAQRCVSAPIHDQPLAIAYVILIAALFIYPALWAAKAEGHQPYQRIAAWADEHLAPGTVIQCDRWLTPWNELMVNVSTNVQYTFLFPNAPPSVYQEGRYRERLMAYFHQNPQAAFLEQKHYWDRISPWSEPHDLFARQQVFLDEATYRLNRIGLAYRGRPSRRVPREEVEITLFYNRQEDILERAQQAGDATLILFGPDWGHAKPWSPPPAWPEQLVHWLWLQAGWDAVHGEPAASPDILNQQPQQALMPHINTGRWLDYRTPPTRSELDVFNLTGDIITGTLEITAISLGGRTGLTVGRQHRVFEPNQLATTGFPVHLQPGRNTLQITRSPDQLLLVRRIEMTD